MSVLFFDIDNTLLSHQSYTIPASALKALRLAKENGHLLFLCSGRSAQGLGEYYDKELYDGLIASSGTAGFFHDEPVFLSLLPEESVREIVSLAREYDLGLFIHCPGRSLMDGFGCERLSSVFQKDEKTLQAMGFCRIDACPAEPVMKIDVFYHEDSPVSEIRNRFPKALEECAHLDPNREDYGSELTIRGVSKGSAVLQILKALNMDPKDSYGFGDSENDIAMLRECGVGIAMGNADPLTKSAADYVTSDIEDDGIWNAMSQFGLL